VAGKSESRSRFPALSIFKRDYSPKLCRLFENDSAFLAAVGFLKMTRLFEKADQLLAMSHGNVITGLIFFRHSSGVSGSFMVACVPAIRDSCTFLSDVTRPRRNSFVFITYTPVSSALSLCAMRTVDSWSNVKQTVKL
jgi:hypothetical protein